MVRPFSTPGFHFHTSGDQTAYRLWMEQLSHSVPVSSIRNERLSATLWTTKQHQAMTLCAIAVWLDQWEVKLSESVRHCCRIRYSLAWINIIKLAVGRRDKTVIPDDPSMSVSSTVFADGKWWEFGESPTKNSPAMAQPNTRPACQSCQPSRFLTPTSSFTATHQSPPISTDVYRCYQFTLA